MIVNSRAFPEVPRQGEANGSPTTKKAVAAVAMAPTSSITATRRLLFKLTSPNINQNGRDPRNT